MDGWELPCTDAVNQVLDFEDQLPFVSIYSWINKALIKIKIDMYGYSIDIDIDIDIEYINRQI